MTSSFLSAILMVQAFSAAFGVPLSPPPEEISPPTDKDSLTNKGGHAHIFTDEWMTWKLKHAKFYHLAEEELIRQRVWMLNREYIDEHNFNQAKELGYALAMNQFGDLTFEEWKQMVLTQYPSRNYSDSNVKVFHGTTNGSYPEQLDWRNKNAVTAVKNQGQCESSYAFGAIGAIEGASSLALEELVNLSEQNIIDCSVPFGNHGCSKGSVYIAFQYVISAGGIDTEQSYPFVAKQSTCHYNKTQSGTSMSGIVRIPPGNETELLAAVATVGPVSIAVDASSNGFRFYDSGLYSSVTCSTTDLNHAMVLTGYGLTDDHQKYWLVKNSWSTNWGEEGYILMSRDKFNQCGIASEALYPTL